VGWKNYSAVLTDLGHAVAQLFEASRKVSGSIPGGLNGIFFR